MTLDYFVLFGSSASAWGHPGLSNLCAVSQHLDALATTRKFTGLPSLCVLLGQMRGAGSVAEDEDVVCAMEKAGMDSMHVHEYLEILGSLLSKGGRLPPTVSITNQVRYHTDFKRDYIFYKYNLCHPHHAWDIVQCDHAQDTGFARFEGL